MGRKASIKPGKWDPKVHGWVVDCKSWDTARKLHPEAKKIAKDGDVWLAFSTMKAYNAWKQS